MQDPRAKPAAPADDVAGVAVVSRWGSGGPTVPPVFVAPPVSPAPPFVPGELHIHGEVPSEQCNRIGTKLLTKLRAAGAVTVHVDVRVKVSPGPGTSAAR